MLKRINLDDLRLGMFIHEFCGSWMEHPFWRAQFLLDQPAQLSRVRSSGIRELWIDTERGLDVADPHAIVHSVDETEREVDHTLASAAAGGPTTLQVELHSELEQARKVVREARPAVLSMFTHARLGRAVDVAGASALVDRIRGAVGRNPAAMLSVARLKQADEYTFMHSVAVSGLMIAFAQQLRLSDDEINKAGMAGLLHDIGKAKVPDVILNKPAALTDEEFAQMRRHPEIGHAMLAEQGQVDSAVLDGVLHHHERIDGNGYPHRLAGSAVSQIAAMTALCDVYDAVTSARVYKPGWDPAEAVRRMAEWSKTHFDPALFQAFVKTVGIYPIGSLVRMESGRLGVVVEQSDRSLLSPRVKVFFSTRSQLRIAPEVIDLSRPNVTDRIVGREDPARWRFNDLETLWQTE